MEIYSKVTEHLPELELELGISISNRKLLIEAMTSEKTKKKHPDVFENDNQCLAFLGDSILNYIASEYVYDKFSKKGDLTTARKKYIKNEHLELLATKLDLIPFFWFEEGYHRNPPSDSWIRLMATFLEAIIGATYLDKGDINDSRIFIEKYIIPNIDKTVP